MSTELDTQPPRNDWISKLIAMPGSSHRIEVAGNSLHYLDWGQPGRTTLVMVHGFLAHAHWWDFVAPWFANDYHIVAMDLGGMGDSGHRKVYTRDLYLEEMAGVIRATSTDPVILIGHSFGGRLAIYACRAYPQLVQHAIVI